MARVVLWLFPSALWVAWGAEMLFLLLLMVELGKRVWPVKQWRNKKHYALAGDRRRGRHDTDNDVTGVLGIPGGR